jgi:hypothetical protein
MAYIFLGTADDKTQEYPFSPSPRHRADMTTLLVMNAVLSPTIAIEEGFLLAAEEIVSLGGAGEILQTAVSSGQVKVMSRTGDLSSYVSLRREKCHASPPDTPAGNAFVAELQSRCVQAGAFLPYPPTSVDELTFDRLTDLFSQDYPSDLMERSGQRPSDFVNRYAETYHTGLNGGRWTARSAWEATLNSLFNDQDPAIRAFMAIGNRQRQLIRAAALAKLIGQDVIVETGYDFGGEDLIDRQSDLVDDIPLRSVGRHSIIRNVSIEELIAVWPLLFQELADRDSPISVAKRDWLRASEWDSESLDGNLQAERFLLATETYCQLLTAIAKSGSRPNDTARSGTQLFGVGASVVLPASLQIVLGGDMTRRDLLRASGLGVLGSSAFLIRPWSSAQSTPSRSRLLLRRPRRQNLEDIGALGGTHTNFHQRVIVSGKGLEGLAMA